MIGQCFSPFFAMVVHIVARYTLDLFRLRTISQMILNELKKITLFNLLLHILPGAVLGRYEIQLQMTKVSNSFQPES